jgi:2-polyprenyl-3-methyl-5-hydroxy-6-metoxy-1,4-benzoquinol methylase
VTENKRNVQAFDRDVQAQGGYHYTDTSRLSSRLSNARMSAAIASAYNFAGRQVIDVGCGDGSYTLELAREGPKHVLGIDPAAAALKRAREKCAQACVENCEFVPASIYDLPTTLHGDFDVAVLRGVLHHLSEPGRAVAIALQLARSVVILEPNGLNPVLKMIEKISPYHIEHEEQSFLPRTIERWCTAGGAHVIQRRFINLVPFFCPDWLAKGCRAAEPLIEALPLVRSVSCGQYLVVAER